MGADLSRFKVIYSDRVLHALVLENVEYRENESPWQNDPRKSKIETKPLFLTVLCINEDGNIVALCDEAWMFQFIPILKKEG